jgi:hypothetical protein
MPVRVLFAGAAQSFDPKRLEAELRRIEVPMLAREDERRGKPASSERSGDGSQLDSFGPGADDQPDIRETQRSP